MLHISSANHLPCVLILHGRSGPRPVSDWGRLRLTNSGKRRWLINNTIVNGDINAGDAAASIVDVSMMMVEMMLTMRR